MNKKNLFLFIFIIIFLLLNYKLIYSLYDSESNWYNPLKWNFKSDTNKYWLWIWDIYSKAANEIRDLDNQYLIKSIVGEEWENITDRINELIERKNEVWNFWLPCLFKKDTLTMEMIYDIKDGTFVRYYDIIDIWPDCETLNPEMIWKYQQIITKYLNESKISAQRMSINNKKIDSISSYIDWSLKTSPFDLLVDIDEINKVIFSSEIIYPWNDPQFNTYDKSWNKVSNNPNQKSNLSPYNKKYNWAPNPKLKKILDNLLSIWVTVWDQNIVNNSWINEICSTSDSQIVNNIINFNNNLQNIPSCWTAHNFSFWKNETSFWEKTLCSWNWVIVKGWIPDFPDVWETVEWICKKGELEIWCIAERSENTEWWKKIISDNIEKEINIAKSEVNKKLNKSECDGMWNISIWYKNDSGWFTLDSCLTIEFLLYNQSLLWSSWPARIRFKTIEGFLDASIEHLWKFVNRSLIQSELSINNFELWLKNFNFPDLFNVNIQIVKKPTPIKNFQNTTQNKPNDDLNYENMMEELFNDLWLFYREINNIDKFLNRDSEFFLMWKVAWASIPEAIENLSDINRLTKDFNIKSAIREESLLNKIDNDTLKDFNLKLTELERFTNYLIQYSNDIKEIIKLMNKIPTK